MTNALDMFATYGSLNDVAALFIKRGLDITARSQIQDFYARDDELKQIIAPDIFEIKYLCTMDTASMNVK